MGSYTSLHVGVLGFEVWYKDSVIIQQYLHIVCRQLRCYLNGATPLPAEACVYLGLSAMLCSCMMQSKRIITCACVQCAGPA